MARYVDPDFVVRAMLLLEPLDRDRRVDVLRRSLKALASYEGESFAARDPISQQIIDGVHPNPTLSVLLTHPGLARQSDEGGSWIELAVMDDGPRKPTYVFLAIHVGTESSQIELQWRVGVEIAPRLVAELRPDLGFMNGKRIADERYGALPTSREYKPAGPPAAMTPWTFLSGERLGGAEVADSLRRLSAARISGLAGGLVVQAVERLEEPPPPSFLEELAQLEIRYIPPQVDLQEENDEG